MSFFFVHYLLLSMLSRDVKISFCYCSVVLAY